MTRHTFRLFYARLRNSNSQSNPLQWHDPHTTVSSVAQTMADQDHPLLFQTPTHATVLTTHSGQAQGLLPALPRTVRVDQVRRVSSRSWEQPRPGQNFEPDQIPFRLLPFQYLLQTPYSQWPDASDDHRNDHSLLSAINSELTHIRQNRAHPSVLPNEGTIAADYGRIMLHALYLPRT